ncbi:hypothetical protein HK096_003521, partial [Nowakowskiella sp. JEL0078]
MANVSAFADSCAGSEVVTKAFCELYRITIDKRSVGTLPYLKTIDEQAPGGVHPIVT